jgi:hypothetical protein
MIVIDCAGDNEIALELENYLKNLGCDVKAEESLVNVDKTDVENILNLFLKETNRSNYKIRKIGSTNFLISKEVSIENLDLLSCEICGYVLSNEYELMNHRRTHGIV